MARKKRTMASFDDVSNDILNENEETKSEFDELRKKKEDNAVKRFLSIDKDIDDVFTSISTGAKRSSNRSKLINAALREFLEYKGLLKKEDE